MRVAETAPRHCHQPPDARWRGPAPPPWWVLGDARAFPSSGGGGRGPRGEGASAAPRPPLHGRSAQFQSIPTSSPTASQGVWPQLGRPPCPGPPASHPDLLPLAGATATRAAPGLSLRVTRAGGVLARPRLTHSPGAPRGVPARPSYAPFPATLSLKSSTSSVI